MNRSMKKIISLVVTLSVLSLTSCQKWLDINVNPNSVSTVENGLIFPAIELNLLTNYGLYGHLVGSYLSEQYAVKPEGPNSLAMAQWLTEEGGAIATNANRIYQQTYIRVINNVKAVREAASENEAWGDYLAATVYRAIAYQMLVDAFGETPYSEAENTAITAPVYDEGKDVYAGIIADLDEALDKLTGGEQVSDNMLFGSSSDINNYIRLANSIKLRLLMRESRKVDVKSALSALVAKNNFITSDIKFASSLFTNEAGHDNPLFEQFVRGAGDIVTGRTMDLAGHMAVISAMTEVNDARVKAKFTPAVTSGLYEGGFIDTQYSQEKTAGYADKNSYAEPVLKYNTPVYLMTVAEVDFFLAEYYASISPDAAKAKAYYEAAIDASFATDGATGAADIYASGAKYAWDASKADELIGIQKWIALTNINGFESWCELRRLGYPEFNAANGKAVYNEWLSEAKANKEASKTVVTPTAEDLVNAGVYEFGKLVTPASLVEMADNTLLGRLPYANSSKTRNANAPAQKEKGAKVFWAK